MTVVAGYIPDRNGEAALTAGFALAILLGLAVAESDLRLGVAPGSLLTWLLPVGVVVVFLFGAVRAQLIRARHPELVARFLGNRHLGDRSPTHDRRYAGRP